MQEIEALLERRTDLSTFLVHLTRDYGGEGPFQNTLGIARELTIQARNPYGMAKEYADRLAGSRKTQHVVCFTETPLQHTWMLTEEIAGRRTQFSQFGWVFSKSVGRLKSCNPVWYLDITPAPTGRDWLTKPFSSLIREAVSDCTHNGDIAPEELSRKRIFEITPFLEQMGSSATHGYRKEFYWEREWRHVGDFSFTPAEVVAILAPSDSHEDLAQQLEESSPVWRGAMRPLLDPGWGLERIIAELAQAGWIHSQRAGGE